MTNWMVLSKYSSRGVEVVMGSIIGRCAALILVGVHSLM